MSAEDLAKLAQNPVGNLVSVPFQNNTNFNTGPLSGTQNILNIQPVIPFTLTKDWNLITRTILPVITQPGFAPGQGSSTGLGDIQFSALASPGNAAGLHADFINGWDQRALRNQVRRWLNRRA